MLRVLNLPICAHSGHISSQRGVPLTDWTNTNPTQISSLEKESGSYVAYPTISFACGALTSTDDTSGYIISLGDWNWAMLCPWPQKKHTEY